MHYNDTASYMFPQVQSDVDEQLCSADCTINLKRHAAVDIVILVVPSPNIAITLDRINIIYY